MQPQVFSPGGGPNDARTTGGLWEVRFRFFRELNSTRRQGQPAASKRLTFLACVQRNWYCRGRPDRQICGGGVMQASAWDKIVYLWNSVAWREISWEAWATLAFLVVAVIAANIARLKIMAARNEDGTPPSEVNIGGMLGENILYQQVAADLLSRSDEAAEMARNGQETPHSDARHP